MDEPVGSGQGDHPEPSPHQHQDGGPPEQAPDTDDSLDDRDKARGLMSHLSSKMWSQSAISVEL